MAIQFGTSGWRSVIADEFTFSQVRTVSQAICDHFKEHPLLPSKFLCRSERYRFLERNSQLMRRAVSANGFRALLCTEFTPTPGFLTLFGARGGRCG